MTSLQQMLIQSTRLLSSLSISRQPLMHTLTRCQHKPLSIHSQFIRQCSTYDPYPKVEDPPSPFKQRGRDRIGYKLKIYAGGPLPRPEGDFEKKKVKNTGIDALKRDQWVEKKALFGQNDYIDILGDGTVHPADLMDGPLWLRKFRGNELQRLIRRLKMTGNYLQHEQPERYHTIHKRMMYLYKRYNRNTKKYYWKGKNPGGRNRIFNLRRRN